MFRGLPAAAHEVMGLPVMGLTGATHMSAAWAVMAKLVDRSRARRNGRRRRDKELAGSEGELAVASVFVA